MAKLWYLPTVALLPACTEDFDVGRFPYRLVAKRVQ